MCDFLIVFAKQIFSLKFSEKPDYSHLKFLLEKNLMDRSMFPNKNFDWIERQIEDNRMDYIDERNQESLE